MIKLVPTKFGGVWGDEKLQLEVTKLESGYALVHVELECVYTTIKGGFSTLEECVKYSNNLISRAYAKAFIG